VPEAEDFDIVPDEDEIGGPRSNWVWVGVTAVVALFAFGVGAAFIILSNRMGPATPDPTPTPNLAVVSPTQVALITATVTITPNATITLSGTPTGTPTVTVTPSPTATPFCSQQVEGLFVPLFDQAQFGCATGPANIVWAAYQPFERGSMLWRSDRDTSYVFYSSGNWFPIEIGWDGGPSADRGAPPPGLQAPQRGFGYVWSTNDEIFNGLGWALDQERGFCALVQDFERGYILRSADVPSCTAENLYNFATASDWTPLLFAAGGDNVWRNIPSTAIPATEGGERPAAGISRPAPNGIFDAIRAEGFTLDADFSEWPGTWLPVNSLILGAGNHGGPGDLSASFQVGWNANGLVLAVRVNDDLYRPGPDGSDLWQGDSLELQFDRQLAEDLNTTTADADDYQVGIAFDDSLSAIRGYLWLPFARESSLSLPGTVVATEQGYHLEVLIPWYVFEMEGNVSTDRAYGFNLSVNDNDSEGSAQETVLSASPARTTHDNPTEWGTLRLLP
jgi:hypothetical protein